MKSQPQRVIGRPRLALRKPPLAATAVAAGIVASLAALNAAPAFAQAAKAVELRYATVAPAKTVWVNQAERVAKAAEEESGGSLKISVFHSGQLGSEVDALQQVARGRIDMGPFSASTSALMVPEMQVLTAPFYFRDSKERDCVIDGLTPVVRELWVAKGVQFLGWGNAGESILAAKRPLTSAADVKGQKFGVTGTKTLVNYYTALGANPTAATPTELAPAFQTGLIDWAPITTVFYVAAGIGKVAPVMTRADITEIPTLTLMNKTTYDLLSPDQQQALSRAWARTPAAQLRKEVRDFEQAMRNAHEKGGGQIVQLTPEQREVWRRDAAAQWPKWMEDSGPGSLKLAQQAEAARMACAKQS
ncbi:MAG: TRAP transporter substrate-binding protein [Rubrivivax sp.]|nr:TRAP transporter substrate-binding protein [Rubrivivax sp.]